MGATLRIDTWDADYGASVEAAEWVPEAVSPAQPLEAGLWEPYRPQSPVAPVELGFIDGVRRIDLRLFAEDQTESLGAGATTIAPALCGSFAVGVVWAKDGSARIKEVRSARRLVVGGGFRHDDIRAPLGAFSLAYSYQGVTGLGPADPVNGLQNAMRGAEADLVQTLSASRSNGLLIIDGPLSYDLHPGSLAVGLVKRQVRLYLPPDLSPILGLLDVGERTPVFVLPHPRLERLSWYVRIAPRRAMDGTMTGIVRLETSAAPGLDTAIRLADAVTVLLPRFATELGRDPRAPQNLYPVAQLEAELHHRLGDSQLIRRALLAALWSQDG